MTADSSCPMVAGPTMNPIEGRVLSKTPEKTVGIPAQGSQSQQYFTVGSRAQKTKSLCKLFWVVYYSSSARIGNLLTRFPVAEKMAFPTAGAIGGTPGSPTPPKGASLETMKTSTLGISFMRRIG